MHAVAEQVSGALRGFREFEVEAGKLSKTFETDSAVIQQYEAFLDGLMPILLSWSEAIGNFVTAMRNMDAANLTEKDRSEIIEALPQMRDLFALTTSLTQSLRRPSSRPLPASLHATVNDTADACADLTASVRFAVTVYEKALVREAITRVSADNRDVLVDLAKR